MTTLLHISDLHFGTVVDAALHGLLDVVDAADPDIIIITGDVTQRGRSSELLGFVGLVDKLKPRTVLVVPGNHDVDWWPPWRRLLTPLRGFEEAVPPENRRPSAVVDDVLFVACGSVDPARQVGGTMSEEALRQLTTIIGATPAAVRVAFTHHPIALDRPASRTQVVSNAAAAATSLASAGVDLLLSGHIHVPFALTTQAAFPSLSRPFVLAGAGTTTSSRTRGLQPRALQLVHIAPTRIDIERFELAVGDFAFAVASTSHFAREDGGWHQTER